MSTKTSDHDLFSAREVDPDWAAWLIAPPDISLFTNDAGYLASGAMMNFDSGAITSDGSGNLTAASLIAGVSPFINVGGNTAAHLITDGYLAGIGKDGKLFGDASMVTNVSAVNLNDGSGILLAGDGFGDYSINNNPITFVTDGGWGILQFGGNQVKVSQLSNDAGYITIETEPAFTSWNDSLTSTFNEAILGAIWAYELVSGGANISIFYNDVGYSTFNPVGTVAYVGDNISEFNNDSEYITSTGAADNLTYSTGGISNLFFPQQAISAPTYVLGGMYFDTTLNKLCIGGASGWETVTSV